MVIMLVLPLLVRWADGEVSDDIRKNTQPIDLVLNSGKCIPLKQILEDNATEIEDWLWLHPEYNINRTDLFYNYWGIAFTLKELGMAEINVFHRSERIKKFEAFMGKSFG